MIRHFYNAYSHGPTQYSEHMAALRSSGLLDECEMSVGLTGQPMAAAFLRASTEHTVVAEDPKGWEQCTIAAMQSALPDMADSDIVFYAHAKGSAFPSEFNDSWRKTMQHFNVDHWRTMVDALTDHDIACIWWISANYHPHPHPQGNYWWARAGYLKTLPPVSMEDRWKAELFVGQGAPRVFDAYPGSAANAHVGLPGFECELCAT